jgi:uncharacterized protein YPO0396
MLQLADSLGEFQSVDIARLEREIHERQTWIEEATAQNPDYVAITAALEKARAAFGDASDRAREIGNGDGPIEDRYLKTKRFIDQVKDVPENAAWRRDVLDSRRWFTFIAQEYKVHSDGSEEVVNDYDGASGSSGGQKERLAMTVMAAGLAWRFGMVNATAAARSFRVLMLDEAFKNSHDDTTRALLELFKAFGFQMVFAMPSKSLAVVANHVERAFAVDTKNRRTVLTVHTLKDLVLSNQSAAAATALQLAKEAGVDIADLDLSEIDEGLAGLTAEAVIQLAAREEAAREAAG